MGKPIGIPTMYDGIMMRSRTEARWAAFFDLAGWEWQYEPFDLNGYIPDFVLALPHGDLLVEVKPVEDQLCLAKMKIEFSGWNDDAIILVDGSTSSLGLLLERSHCVFSWEDANAFYCLSCGNNSIHSASGSMHCRVCGEHGGNSHVGEWDTRKNWHTAGNRVQWKAPTVNA